ncbi:MAG TPA: hypothetical protein PLH98_11820 [Ruminococcus flavefaciens]|nr:hypothetical protein [Ruminococcus flavefaciens]
MSDFYKKRVEYINNWPESEPFEAEIEYKKLCDDFKEKNGRLPFTPMEMWESPDVIYNRVLSHIIECLEVIPYEPNHAFNYLFLSFDHFSKEKYQKDTTSNLKCFCEIIMSPSDSKKIIEKILSELFNTIPLDLCKYLYKQICTVTKNKKGNETKQVFTRISTNSNNKPIKDYEDFLNSIINKYDYSDDDKRRKAARLLQKIFKKESIILNEKEIDNNIELQLALLLSGVIYSLRNDSLHGSSMSSTKSSETDNGRYASNYYSFISIYVLLMLLLIEGSFSDEKEKETYYNELLIVTKKNIADFKSLFQKYLE